jgi:hypothetical protein
MSENETQAAAVIEGAFALWPEGATAFRIDTAEGPTFLLVRRFEFGTVRFLYPLLPVANSLLERYASDPTGVLAQRALMYVLRCLHTGLSIALDNVADVANLATLESVESLASLLVEQYEPAEVDRRRAETLARMNERNELMLERPAGGKKKQVTLQRVSAAIALLRKEGSQVTLGNLDIKLGVADGTVDTALRRARRTLDEVIEWVDSDNQPPPLSESN